MTSTPLRQFFPTLGVVILLGFFLYNMTAGTPGAQEADLPAPAAQAADVPTVITVRCAHRPEFLSISHGGRVLWQSGTPGLELEPEGRPSASATRWSFGPSLNDSYSFSWK